VNGRIIPFEGPVHVQVDRLLPWYANGTLEDDERAQVEQHLAECAQCQREVRWLRALHGDFAEQAKQDGALLETPHPRRYEGMPSKPSRLSLFQGHRGRWLALLAALQAMVILVLGTLVFTGQRAPYRTLSAPSDHGALLAVSFDSRTSEAQLRQLLRAQNARIVGGPTEDGTYVVRVPEERELAARKAWLGSTHVTLVEELDSGGAP
jgi:anti-sigma factor RsiW